MQERCTMPLVWLQHPILFNQLRAMERLPRSFWTKCTHNSTSKTGTTTGMRIVMKIRQKQRLQIQISFLASRGNVLSVTRRIELITIPRNSPATTIITTVVEVVAEAGSKVYATTVARKGTRRIITGRKKRIHISLGILPQL